MITRISRTKIEIVVDVLFLPRLLSMAALAGVRNHTLLPVLGGSGHAGDWSEDLLTRADNKLMFMAVADEEPAERFLDLLAPQLSELGAVAFVSETTVLREHRF